MNSKLNTIHPALQLLVLFAMSLIGVLLFTFIGVIISTFIYGPEALSLLSVTDYNNADYVGMMKLLQAMSHLGMFIIPGLVFSKLASGSYFGYFVHRKNYSLPLLGLAFLLIYLIQPLIGWVGEWNVTMKLPESMASLEASLKSMEEAAALATNAFMADLSVSGLVLNLLIMAIIPAIGEELVFRGVLQQSLQKWFKNGLWAVLVASVVFSLFHMQWYGFFPRLMLGLLLGFVFYKSGNIWLASFVHFLNNGTVVIAIWLAGNRYIPVSPESIEKSNFPLVVVAVSSILFAVVMYFFIQFINRKEKQN